MFLFRLTLAAMFLVGFSDYAQADDEASNTPHVAAGDYGRCFAHSVPSESYGTAGRTDVYLTGDEFVRSHSFDWYAPQLKIACNVSDREGRIGPALVQIGPWPRGRFADEETLALAFYYDGAFKAGYSTLDIAGGEKANVSCSVSHYTVIERIDGFNHGADGELLFRVTTIDGRQLSFNVVTGALAEIDTSETRTGNRGACSY